MIARAPGKLVLSGAYAVLEGGPALVSAVDRYVEADARRHATRVTPELEAAFAGQQPPWFDASALRAGAHKLGLGSSAAIVTACLASAELTRDGWLEPTELCARVYPRALAAHRIAQPDGSGIDVAAACHGGSLLVRRLGTGLELSAVALPAEIRIAVWSSGVPASTPALLQHVRRLREQAPARYRTLIAAQCKASEDAARALVRADARGLVLALAEQLAALSELGAAAGAEIVTPAARRLSQHATGRAAVVLPAGAGGGDVILYAGLADPTPELCRLAESLGHRRLELGLGAPGVHAAPA